MAMSNVAAYPDAPLYDLINQIVGQRPGLREAFATPDVGTLPRPVQTPSAVPPPAARPEDMGIPDQTGNLDQAPPSDRLAAFFDSVGGAARPAAGRQTYFPGKEADDRLPTAPAPAAPPASDSDVGPLGRLLPSGIRNTLVDALTGMAGADPRQPGLTAMAQGAAGALGNQQRREDRKMALATAADDREYERGRDARADARADNADSRADRAEGRADKAESRAEREAVIDEIAKAAGIEQTLAETRKIEKEYARRGLSVAQTLEFERTVDNHIRSMFGDNPGPAVQSKIKEERATFRETLMAQVDQGADPAALTAPSAADSGDNAAPGGISGDGQYATPYSWGAGMDAAGVRSAVEQLPKGAYFVDPATGATMRRR